MDRPTHSEEASRLVVNALQDQLANHLDESGMSAGGRGPHHRDAEFFRNVLRLVVEIVNDFHVVRNKTDRSNHHAADPLSRELA